MLTVRLLGRGLLHPAQRNAFVRKFTEKQSNQTHFARRAAERQTLKERMMAPAGDGAFQMGKGALAVGSGLGLGMLAYYGLGLSSKMGAADRASMWPTYVKERIQTTYLYLGGGLALTAGGAYATLTSPALLRLMGGGSMMAVAGTMIAMIATSMLTQSIPYKPGVGPKQMAWMLHATVVGSVIAPLCLLGGPIIARAALYTAGVVGGLSTVAVCAPSDQFLQMGGPLAIGLGVVFVASLGSMFLPPTTAMGAGLYSISLYGGLLLFSAFLLHDTQRIIQRAELVAPDDKQAGVYHYDPVNASMSVYMDTINIFVRIATILADRQNKKK